MADSSISTSTARDNDRQLDELKSAHERKLAQLRAQQQKEESEARESGDAAVNHIRKATEDRIEHARQESEARTERESDSLSKNYGALKKRAAEQTQASEKEIAASREHADSSIESNKTREEQAMKQSQEKLKDFLAKQRDLRAATERKSSDEMRQDELRNNSVRRKAQVDADRDLHNIEADHKERVHDITEENKTTYDDLKTQAERRLAELRRNEDLKLKHERDQDNDAFLHIHQKSHDDIQKEQMTGQARLSSTLEESQHKLEAARARSLSTNEKLQREYSNEAQRVEMEGQRDINDRREKFALLAREQKQTDRDELKSLTDENEAQKEKLRVHGQAELKETVAKLNETLHQKTEKFNKQFIAEDAANRNSLDNQKEIFLKQQYKQRRAQDDAIALDQSRKGDLFYQPKSFDANLTEHEDKYVLTAKVPSYEKDNVEVRVKDGKVTLSSARAFQDSVKDGDTRFETSSNQSYRQEFALAKPADAKHVLTSVKDDGSIIAIIPKKGFLKT